MYVYVRVCVAVFPLKILLLSQFDLKFKELAQNTKMLVRIIRVGSRGPPYAHNILLVVGR